MRFPIPLTEGRHMLQSLLAICVAFLLVTSPANAKWEVAPVNEALTFARVAVDGKIHTLAVIASDDTTITAVDLSAALDQYPELPLDILDGKALDDIAALMAGTPAAAQKTIPLADLLPVATARQNIAAGTNYAEHGEEASIDAPFLFPKIADPTPYDTPLTAQPEWLLDYEVELAIVFDRDIQGPEDLKFARAGLFVVNDFTERATLLREANLTDPSAGDGFANAKGQPGFFPTGPWMIVPRGDWREAYGELTLTLTVNDETRQNETADTMIWNIDKIVMETFKTGGKGSWVHNGTPVDLYASTIPKGTALLTGTPGGVVFHAPGTGYIAATAAGWLFSFSFTSQGLMEYMREALYQDRHAEGIFLKPGDKVVASGTWMGAVETDIVAGE